jgi:glycerol uptake facilitator-like aquaporin
LKGFGLIVVEFAGAFTGACLEFLVYYPHFQIVNPSEGHDEKVS